MLKLFLRLIGTTSGLALVAVFLPYAWMNAIHAWVGMGPLPPDPIVGYLARTLSAFYAFYGGLLWFLSFDIPRYRRVIRYVGAATLAFGFILLGVDWTEGMPAFWKWLEGPIAILYGILILALTRDRGEPSESDTSQPPSPSS